MKRMLICWLLGLLSWGLMAQDTLFVSTTQVVHLRFASELKYVNLGSRELVARIVDGSKDFVAVKAREAFDGVTSLSCLEVSGEMHTFLVAYSERVERLEVDMRKSAVTPGLTGSLSYSPQDTTFSSRSLSDYAAMKQELYHLGTREYGIELRCENIFVKEDVLYLVFSLRNDSAVSYEISTPRFAVESARRSRRGLQYEKAVLPRSAYGMGTVAPGSESRMVFAFDKLALVKGQVFRVYFYEKGGSRNLRVTMSGRDVNGARRILKTSLSDVETMR